MVSGRASPLAWTEETTLQFELARRAAARMALDYPTHGFAVMLDDVVRDVPAHYGTYERQLDGREVRKVLLAPGVGVILSRNAGRKTKPFDSAELVPHIAVLHDMLMGENTEARGWFVLDTGLLSPEATADVLLRHWGSI